MYEIETKLRNLTENEIMITVNNKLELAIIAIQKILKTIFSFDVKIELFVYLLIKYNA